MILSSTKIEILDIAQDMIQSRGYNGFSFADISKKVGIRKASIHYHFSSKAMLGMAVIRRYREKFNEHLNSFDQKNSVWLDKIHKYADLYEDTLLQNKLCLCGMLATDIETLPKILKKELRAFFEDNITWLNNIIKKQFLSVTDAHRNEIASHVISTLQGGIILARSQNQTELFFNARRSLNDYLKKLK